MSSTDTQSIRKSVLIHIFIWLIALLFPGFQSGNIFQFVWVGGLIIISGATLLALALSVIKMLKERKRNRQSDAVVL